MPRGIPVDQATKVRAKKLHAQGKGRNEIAKTLGISTFAVTRISQELGFSFDRAQTEVAVRANSIDRAARRGKIIDRLYARSERILDRLEADEYSYRMPTMSGSETVVDDAAPAADERHFATSMAHYLVQAVRLEQVDSDRGVGDAVSVLDSLSAALKVAADVLDSPAQD